MCGQVKNTSIVPFTAGSGISYSGEYNNIGRLEFVGFSKYFFLKSVSSSMLGLYFGGFLASPIETSELKYELSDFFFPFLIKHL